MSGRVGSGELPVATDLEGKVALVTGGGKGVGAAISRELAQRGAHVIVNYFHSPDAANATVEAVRAAGGQAQAVRASIAKPEQVTGMFAAVEEEHGGLDILVNNAARGVFARYDDLTDVEWQRALDTNLHGARWCSLAAAPLMEARGGGAIVNVSSVGAGMAMDNYLLVGVSKAALEALTRYLAADLGPLGIRVNTASAGLLDNPTATLFPGAAELRATCSEAAPLGGVGTERDLAQLVAFLASPQSGWVSGQCLLADGGLSTGRAMLTARPVVALASSQGATDDSGARRDRGRSGDAVPAPEGAATVAIVGMGLVGPGVDSPDALWERLLDGAGQFTEPGGDRFNVEHFYSVDPDAVGRTYSRVAGYAATQGGDAAQDYLTSWAHTALTQAGAPGVAASGAQAACFVGAWNEGSQHVEESVLVETAATGIAAHWNGGAGKDGGSVRDGLRERLRDHYPHAGALSDHLPLAAVTAAVARLLPSNTPVQVIDTACSSSLFAIDAGVRAVLDGTCDVALCGGAFSLGPRYDVLFSQLGGLSRAGAVRSFDADADGVLFSDGVGFVALKRLDRARRDGDRIWGVLAGFGAASDGRGRAVHAPNHTGQQRALERARAVAGLPAEEIDWVVAHATGTPVGDRVERGVMHAQLPQAWCTSNKSVVGHTGWTAGVLSVIHALKGLEHGGIPAQVPYTAPEDAPRVRVPETKVELPRHLHRPRTVGVSAFGFGGTNGHLLVQDAPRDGEAAPASLPPVLENDPVVAVAWAAHLPGNPGRPDVAARLSAGQPPAQSPSFGVDYPLPLFHEVRMPSRTAAGIDRAQLMALQAVSLLDKGRSAPWWDGLAETCGVFTAHTGVPATSPAITVRAYAESLSHFARSSGDQDLQRALDAFLEQVGTTSSPVGEDTLAGLMPNVIPGRIAALNDLHGPTMTLDTGPTSGRTAMTAAAGYLRRGQLDLALVIGVNGASSQLFSRLYDLPYEHQLAEGAFALVLTRASVAERQGWKPLARLDALLDALPAQRPDPIGKWTYYGADDLVHALRHLNAPAAESRTDDVSPPPDAATTRHTVAWHQARTSPHGDGDLPAHTLVITGPGQAAALGPAVQASPSSQLLIVHPADDPEQAVDQLLADQHGFRHLRVIATVEDAVQDAAVPPGLLTVQEAAFWAVRQLRDDLVRDGSVATAVICPFSGGHPEPHAHLFTGFIKSLAWDLEGCTVRSLVTDRTDPRTVLTDANREVTTPPDGLPVVYQLGTRRLVQRLVEDVGSAPAPNDWPLAPGSVVVATGGARGITAACILGLARHVPLHVHLVGSSSPGSVPQELLDTPDDALPAARARYIVEQRSANGSLTVREINAQFDRLLHARESALTLRALRELCGTEHVHFHTCDVTDAAAVHAVAETVRKREGRVDLLVNGAGLHYPGDITRKTLPGMRRIRDVKLFGYHHLRSAFTGTLTPRLWCNFGSVTGVVGLPGESDYSPANDFLSAAAASRDTGEYTIAWTIWDETGLGSGAVVQSYTARTARLSRMTTAEGVAHFLTELRRRPQCPHRVVTFIGDAERQTFDARFPNLYTAQAGAIPEPDDDPTATHPPGLLGTPTARDGNRSARWNLTLHPDDHTFLRDHLVNDKPTVPGVMLVDIAVQASRILLPGQPLRSVDHVTFTHWVRAREGDAPTHYRVHARRAHAARGSNAVVVTIYSDVIAPNGHVLVRDRQHFRATVHLGAPTAAPAPPGPDNGPRQPVSDPYYTPASPVALTGPFRATNECHTTTTGSGARWQRTATQLNNLPTLSTPATLLDSLARTPTLRPGPDGQHDIAVPQYIERVVLYKHGDDHALAHDHPDGLNLHHVPATATSTAYTNTGQLVAQIIGMRWNVLARIGTPTNTETGHGPTT